ncbi:hypothetical protein CC86DRAFT_360526 [Ophiobolus disseminans]|uniref:Uncharacterized protein n=1 Tax=Ophiobolus disseminans TaxID=1469910 RepID=A0A6A6ZJ06_9PLEO|nr:hypothetical protein CC86DRAFT_360526 [Ophiobolus disseminans]
MSVTAAHTGPSSFSTPGTLHTTVTPSERGNEEPTSSASTPVNSASVGPSQQTWTKLKPLNARDAILRPLAIDTLPAPKANEALFLLESADRLWYMGFVEPWKEFNADATKFWNSKEVVSAFHEIGGKPRPPPRATDNDVASDSHPFELLTSWFQRDVVEFVIDISNGLMLNSTAKEGSVQGVFLGEPSEEDLGNNECKWDPTFVVKAALQSVDLETRALGQVEYLGGKAGALTSAIDECPRNTWGSLRCVLGDIARFMLMSSTRYAFLLSSDEIIFLKTEIMSKCEYPRGRDPVDLFVEPWLFYSAPIKFTDILDEDKGTIPVKLALLYLLQLSKQGGWQMHEEIGDSLKYFETRKAGERYIPKLDFIGPDGKLKLLGKY